MKTSQNPMAALSDAALIAEVQRLVRCERTATAALLRSLMEFDTRRLYLGEGYPSLFAYCTKVLHYAEHAALNRIEVARAARRLPVLLDYVADGRLHITGARLLGPHLTEENADALLAAARHKSKREIEELIAALRPKPAVAATLRKVPSPEPPPTGKPAQIRGAEESTTAPPASATLPNVPGAPIRPTIAPLAPERYKVQFTITRETRDKLRQVQDLMRHTIPSGDPAAIFDRALTILLEELQRKRFADTRNARGTRSSEASSRYIPAAVRRAVWRRDGGRCVFVGSHGICGERGFVEFHHVVPFAAGGLTTVANIELRCRAHNAHEASLFVGAENGNIVREAVWPWGEPQLDGAPSPSINVESTGQH